MENEIIIQVWENKCRFCGKVFEGSPGEEMRLALRNHILNHCNILNDICLAKSIEYPLEEGGAICHRN